jgi:hypothetical protein
MRITSFFDLKAPSPYTYAFLRFGCKKTGISSFLFYRAGAGLSRMP